MYTIVDLETTGGKFNEESIIEVAAYRFDGSRIKDQFISLVNPQKDIHPYVEKLTGISSKMVKTAPKFHEVAKRILEITSDSILVAHNAQFDYRILQLEFKRLGYDFLMKSICTVILSQELLPDQESYKLGRLSRSLGIPLKDRHRASGDALATVELFKILMEKDTKQDIIKKSIVEFPGESMNSLFKETIESCVHNYLFIQKADGNTAGYGILGITRNHGFLQRFGIVKKYQNSCNFNDLRSTFKLF